MCHSYPYSFIDSRRPTDAIGGAWSQSPVWGDDAAKSLALFMSLEVLESILVIWLAETRPSQAFWMQHCWLTGLLTPDCAAQVISAVSVDLSSYYLLLLRATAYYMLYRVYAIARSSVRPSHGWIIEKRLKLGLW